MSRRQGGRLRVLLSPGGTGSRAGFMATMTLAPGEFMSEHYHPYSDEFLYAVRGDTTLLVEGTRTVLSPGEAAYVGRGRRHRLENRGAAESVCLLFDGPLAPSPESGHVDTEPVPFPDAAPPRIGGDR